jgi:hypothetical protein
MWGGNPVNSIDPEGLDGTTLPLPRSGTFPFPKIPIPNPALVCVSLFTYSSDYSPEQKTCDEQPTQCPYYEATGKQGDFWKNLDSYRGKTKTNSEKGKKRRFYEWDHTHGDVEEYDSNGRHAGTVDPQTGQQTKPPVPGRKIDL